MSPFRSLELDSTISDCKIAHDRVATWARTQKASFNVNFADAVQPGHPKGTQGRCSLDRPVQLPGMVDPRSHGTSFFPFLFFFFVSLSVLLHPPVLTALRGTLGCRYCGGKLFRAQAIRAVACDQRVDY